jgi:hypothetical protein
MFKPMTPADLHRELMAVRDRLSELNPHWFHLVDTGGIEAEFPSAAACPITAGDAVHDMMRALIVPKSDLLRFIERHNITA